MSRELLRKALESLKSIPEAHECLHEETERLGFIWTRCQQCGRKWTDQDGPPKHRHAGVASVMEEISAELARPEPVPLSDDAIEQAYNEAWRSLPSDFGHTSGDWFAAGARYAAAEVARAVAAERERCAKVCERYAEAAKEFWPHDETVGVVVRVLSSRIRHVDGLQDTP